VPTHLYNRAGLPYHVNRSEPAKKAEAEARKRQSLKWHRVDTPDTVEGLASLEVAWQKLDTF